MYKTILKPLLFSFQPEKAHKITMQLFRLSLSLPFGKKIFKSLYTLEDKKLQRTLFGLNFDNPVGLAAGFDKDGRYFKDLENLGFGFIEIGTVTPKPQDGNPKPRLFRLKEDAALINRMGFNNEGLDAFVERIKKRSNDRIIIGGNIGKNKVTPNEMAFRDYEICFEALYPYVDYFVVNVSSPNTPNLRDLQEKEPLTKLLNSIQKLNQDKIAPKPILLKIAPDLTEGQLDDIIDIVSDTKIDGLIATNTTIDRSNLSTDQSVIQQIGNGGLSGAPLRNRSTEIIRYIHTKSNGSIPIVGVGGISKPEDAIEKLEAGASLVQVYSGLVYYGPGLIRDINKAILDKA
ncbi:MAG: quinone-dependent dihydroorotate dehydrogenase [Saprospiraceae bacterium]|nr:quinone-dependent dihydroorotate dehydrogenase [Saprospiraceae bacterium]